MSTDASPVLSELTSPSRPSTSFRRHPLLQNYFYFLMTLLITGIVVYGFSHTVDQNLFHPAFPAPSSFMCMRPFSPDGWSCLFSSPRWSAAITSAGTAASGGSAQASEP